MTMSRTAIKSINGTAIGPVGYGLTMPWAPVDYPIAAEIMKQALESGANFWNGGIHYGTPNANSLHLLKYYFTQYPADASRVVLSIKGALSRAGPTGSPEALRKSVEDAVEVLEGVKKIDVFEMARVDPEVSIETSVAALAELVTEGKIGGIGLSEVSAATIRRAHAVHPVSAVEVELSIFTPDPLHNGIVETCQELHIPLIAYSPISRGWLTGHFRKPSDLAESDYRNMFPRFKPEAFAQNFKLVEAVEKLAERKGVKTAQVAIGWVCRQGAIPIPGSTKLERVLENTQPADLSDEELEEIRDLMETLPIAGDRYGGGQEKLLNA